jgi:hypothetical protein
MGKIKGSGLLVCDRQSRYTPLDYIAGFVVCGCWAI